LSLLFEELTRCSLFNYIAQLHKLVYPLLWLHVTPTLKIIHRRSADRAQNNFALIEHRELNDHPIEVVASHLASLKRHCKRSMPEEFIVCRWIDVSSVPGRLMSYGADIQGAPQSGLTSAARITLPHFSVSSAMNLPKSAGVIDFGTLPTSAKRAIILGSVRTASRTRAGVSPAFQNVCHWLRGLKIR
jgi:hypothetical protein